MVEEDVSFDPTNVSLLGADAIAFEADGFTDPVK